ncbi:MAG: hypothetical protein M1820_009308 [Bogoriella megaspora]|nr:MAG: hypothetical protein M1820_009308 [Bogoriella megaspora]
MSTPTDLGNLRLAHRETGLQLSSSVSAITSDPLRFEGVITQKQKILHRPESDLPWISCGSNLCIVLHISADEEGTVSSLHNQALLGSVGEMLREAEFFSQLGLQLIVSIHPASESEQTNLIGTINIDLSYQRDGFDSRKPYHRLLRGVSHADFHPPKDTVTINIEEILFSFHFPHPRVQCKHKYQSLKQSQSSLQQSNLESFVQAQSNDDDMLENEIDNHSSSPGLLFAEDEDADFTEDLEMLDGSSSTRAYPQLPTPSTSQESQAPESAAPTDSKSSTPYSATTETAALLLIDTAIRQIICKKRLTGGFATRKDNLRVRLADIAPALFSPGYLAAAAQRSAFIPTIARALSTKIAMNAVDPGLRQKLARLQQPAGACAADVGGLANEPNERTSNEPAAKNNVDTPNDAPEQQRKLHDGITSRLWRMVQNGVFDPNAAKKLKPLASSQKRETGSFNATDEMLELETGPATPRDGAFGLLDDEENDQDLMFEDDINDDDSILEVDVDDDDDLLDELIPEPALEDDDLFGELGKGYGDEVLIRDDDEAAYE